MRSCTRRPGHARNRRTTRTPAADFTLKRRSRDCSGPALLLPLVAARRPGQQDLRTAPARAAYAPLILAGLGPFETTCLPDLQRCGAHRLFLSSAPHLLGSRAVRARTIAIRPLHAIRQMPCSAATASNSSWLMWTTMSENNSAATIRESQWAAALLEIASSGPDDARRLYRSLRGQQRRYLVRIHGRTAAAGNPTGPGRRCWARRRNVAARRPGAIGPAVISSRAGDPALCDTDSWVGMRGARRILASSETDGSSKSFFTRTSLRGVDSSADGVSRASPVPSGFSRGRAGVGQPGTLWALPESSTTRGGHHGQTHCELVGRQHTRLFGRGGPSSAAMGSSLSEGFGIEQ